MTRDPSPSGETARWFCTMPRNLGRCFGPNTAPGHHACGPTWDCPTCDGEGCEEGCGRRGGCDDAYSGPDSHKTCRSCRGWGRTETEPPPPAPPVPSSDTPSDERARLCDGSGRFVGTASAGKPCPECGGSDTTIRGWVIRHYMPRPTPPPTPVDGDSGRRGKAQIMATALHDAGVNTTVSASDNGLLIRVHDRHTPRLLELLAPPPVGEERRPVDVTALPEWAALIDAVGAWGTVVGKPSIDVYGAAKRLFAAAADRGDRA